MTKKLILALTLIVFTTLSVQADTLLVPSEYVTIQLAIHNSNDGDIIIVAPGTYLENVNFLGKDIVLTSTDPQDPEIVATTIINGYGSGSTVSFINNESREAVITGFTISGGYGTENNDIEQGIFWGAGVYCFNSSPTITGNVIANNNGPMKIEGNQAVALSYGAGISCLLSSPLITNNIIRNNKAYAGAGIMTYVGNEVIRNNLIYNNSGYIGGGLVLIGPTLLINNTIVANDSSNRIEGQEGIAGNIYAVSDPEIGHFTIINNIICNAKSGGGLLATDINDNTIEFNNVWNNTMGDYLSIDNQTGQMSQGRSVNQTGKNGNISTDPLCLNMQNHDYHLQIDSLCINAGDPNYISGRDQTDIDGDPRVYASRIDIGADEYVGYIKPVANAGPDQFVGPTQLVTLDGSVTFVYDPNSIVTFEWNQISGPRVELTNPTSMHPTFIPQIQSQYIFELVISDGLYASQPDQVTIFVQNRAPVADAGPDQSFSSVPSIVTLDGSGSYDPEGENLAYRWRQISGPPVELNDADTVSPNFVPVPYVLTVYIFELIVKDRALDSEPDTVAVIIGR